MNYEKYRKRHSAKVTLLTFLIYSFRTERTDKYQSLRCIGIYRRGGEGNL